MPLSSDTPRQNIQPIEGESLLRIALFSNSLQLKGSTDARDSLLSRRTILAKNLREERKKGVIPVLVSFLVFVFALGLSIELAFNDVGGNATAHNLAMGLLVGWLPVLIVGCAVDRNLVSSDSVRERLNALIYDVRCALRNSGSSENFKIKPSSTGAAFAGHDVLESGPGDDAADFFIGFGGQGRTHFHYGVAHPILSGIESKFIANCGRGWLRNGHAARHAMVMGSRNPAGLKMFDARMLWQVLSSFIIVAGTVFASFILSWFTPTVGLGCRTGGYLVYIVIAMGLLLIELLTWGLTHETTNTQKDPLRRIGSKLQRNFSSRSSSLEKEKTGKERIEAFFKWFESGTFRDVMKNFVIRPIEATNTGWLVYIIFAQWVDPTHRHTHC